LGFFGERERAGCEWALVGLGGGIEITFVRVRDDLLDVTAEAGEVERGVPSFVGGRELTTDHGDSSVTK